MNNISEIQNFRLPRYNEIPDVGLYLEQTAKYINSYLSPLGIAGITTSMISNYVKKGYISNPVKKQYYAEQIAYLFFIAIVKNVLSMENIQTLFEMQKSSHDAGMAYNYFCSELENVLQFIFGIKESMGEIGQDATRGKKMLRSTVIAVSHIIYLGFQFKDTESPVS
jgi:DNA-binding transcriptional MerR regulator